MIRACQISLDSLAKDLGITSSTALSNRGSNPGQLREKSRIFD